MTFCILHAIHQWTNYPFTVEPHRKQLWSTQGVERPYWMLAHLSFDLPVPRPARRCRPVLTYRVSSGCDSTVFAPAPLTSVRPSNFGACKKQHHVHVAHPTQTVEHVVTDCVLLKSPGDLTALCCPNAETRSWLSELPIELWTLIFDYLVVVWQTLIYIYIKMSDITNPSYNKVILLVPALYIS